MQLRKDTIKNYSEDAEAHGRLMPLPAGPYVVSIYDVKLDYTGYGNQCLKVVYDIAEGEHAGRFSSILGDEDSNWQHQLEIDIEESNGGRLNAFIKAVQESNPGYVFDWNDPNNIESFNGKIMGIILQERLQTNTRGKRKGQTARYLDLWDTVAADAVRAGLVHTPPVNDKRTNKEEDYAGVAAPVSVPAVVTQPVTAAAPQTGYAAPQAGAAAGVPTVTTAAVPQMGGMPYQQPAMPQVAAAPQPMAQQPMAQQPMAPQPTYQQPAMTVPVTGYNPDAGAVYDSDIPF